MMPRACQVVALLLLPILLIAPRPSRLAAQQPALPDVLALAAKYVEAFADPSRALFCEERYEHTFIKVIVNMAGSSERLPQGGHVWVAEMAVVATPEDAKNGFPWLEFRDILTLDGNRQRDGTSRLGMLVNQPLAIAGPEALRITRESPRTQFGRLNRSVLLPRLALVFLHAVNQPRFDFKKGGDRTIQGVKTWEVKFQEKKTPTIITATSGQDAPSSGSFWIDPATGHVLASRLRSADSSALYDDMSVTYALDQGTGLWLPATMSDKTSDNEEEREIEGKGTFKNWHIVARTPR